MKIKQLIEMLSKYNPDTDIALGDLQNDCCDKDIKIIDNTYCYDDGELIYRDNYDDYEWEVLNVENELIKTLLLV